MSYLIGELEVQGEPSKVVQLFPDMKVISQYKSRFRRRREAMGPSPAHGEIVAADSLVMLRADVVDTSPCETNPA